MGAVMPWTERQIVRFNFRAGLFKRRGLSEADAEQLAERLHHRDMDLCELRMCIECSNLQRGGTCHALSIRQKAEAQRKGWRVQAVEVIAQQFIRCPHFNWAVPA